MNDDVLAAFDLLLECMNIERECLISLLKETASNKPFVKLKCLNICVKRIGQLIEHTQRLKQAWKDLSEAINKVKVIENRAQQTEEHQMFSLEDKHAPELLIAERLFGGNKRDRSKYFIKRTSSKAYWLPILEALVQLGGKGHTQQLMKIVFEKMKQQLTEDDLMPLPSKRSLRWEASVRRARLELIREELLYDGSPTDVWEITEAGRAYLDRMFNQKD